MQIVLLDEARRRFEAEDDWWREHRDATQLFVDEFAQVLERLRSMPGAGQRYRLVRGKLIQHVLMKKTGCHVHFHDRERDLIEIRPILGPAGNAARGSSESLHTVRGIGHRDPALRREERKASVEPLGSYCKVPGGSDPQRRSASRSRAT